MGGEVPEYVEGVMEELKKHGIVKDGEYTVNAEERKVVLSVDGMTYLMAFLRTVEELMAGNEDFERMLKEGWKFTMEGQ